MQAFLFTLLSEKQEVVMKKISKKAVCLILAVAVCFSLIPVSASAENGIPSPELPEVSISSSEPTKTPVVEPTPEITSTPEPEKTPIPTETPSQANEQEPEPTPKPRTADISGIQPILFRTVKQPLVLSIAE